VGSRSESIAARRVAVGGGAAGGGRGRSASSAHGGEAGSTTAVAAGRWTANPAGDAEARTAWVIDEEPIGVGEEPVAGAAGHVPLASGDDGPDWDGALSSDRLVVGDADRMLGSDVDGLGAGWGDSVVDDADAAAGGAARASDGGPPAGPDEVTILDLRDGRDAGADGASAADALADTDPQPDADPPDDDADEREPLPSNVVSIADLLDLTGPGRASTD
jgi:hypothetical protein